MHDARSAALPAADNAATAAADNAATAAADSAAAADNAASADNAAATAAAADSAAADSAADSAATAAAESAECAGSGDSPAASAARPDLPAGPALPVLPVLPVLPPLRAQAERLVATGVHEVAGLSAAEVHAFAETAEGRAGNATAEAGGGRALLAVHPDRAPASALAPLLRHHGRAGFVVSDMTDVDLFAPLDTVTLPDTPLYLLTGLDRGDRMAGWSPNEALPALHAEGRTPLLLTEGIHWVLQQPAALERGHCFMTIGSRLRRPGGALDARTPAIWVSNGTGRDGRERRNAPKIGWCWAGNRHTWLGFGSATGRDPSRP